MSDEKAWVILPVPLANTMMLEVDLPEDAVILEVTARNDVPTLWIRTVPGKDGEPPKLRKRKFRAIAQGRQQVGTPKLNYIGTYLLWHSQQFFLFEEA